jgi:hypothetical protein
MPSFHSIKITANRIVSSLPQKKLVSVLKLHLHSVLALAAIWPSAMRKRTLGHLVTIDKE